MKLSTMAEKNAEKIWKAGTGPFVKNRQYPMVQIKQVRTPTTHSVSLRQRITSEVVICTPEVSPNTVVRTNNCTERITQSGLFKTVTSR